MDMSPRSTLNSCGSSSSEVRRSTRTDAGDARVVPRGLPQAARFRRMVAHRAELQHFEADIAETYAPLVEQDGAGTVDADRQRNQQHRQAEDDEQEPGR